MYSFLIKKISTLIIGTTVAHKTVPMFCCFGQMDLVWSDDISEGSEIYVKQTTSSWLYRHLMSCDLNKNTQSNEQNNIGTHWDSFVSIYYFTI